MVVNYFRSQRTFNEHRRDNNRLTFVTPECHRSGIRRHRRVPPGRQWALAILSSERKTNVGDNARTSTAKTTDKKKKKNQKPNSARYTSTRRCRQALAGRADGAPGRRAVWPSGSAGIIAPRFFLPPSTEFGGRPTARQRDGRSFVRVFRGDNGSHRRQNRFRRGVVVGQRPCFAAAGKHGQTHVSARRVNVAACRRHAVVRARETFGRRTPAHS